MELDTDKAVVVLTLVDCYFVLCIARGENRVAGRRASQRVLGNAWDEIKEPAGSVLGRFPGQQAGRGAM